MALAAVLLETWLLWGFRAALKHDGSGRTLRPLPKSGMAIAEGKVVKVTEELIHVIVLGFSSAVITDEDVRNEYKYKTAGTMIRFLVKSMDEETLHIYGSLIPANTGSIKILDKPSEHTNTERLTINSTPKKRRIKEQEAVAEITQHGSTVKDAPLHNNYDREIKKS